MSRLRRRHPDAVLFAVFLTAHLLERLFNPEAEGSVAANVVGSIVMSVPLLWLRRRPLAAVVGLVAGGVLNQEIATGTDELMVVLVELIVAGFVVARHHDGRERWVAIGVGMAALALAEAVFGGGDVAFVLLLVGGGAIGGTLVRSRAELTRELAERTHELEALRELGERDAVLAERRRIARELHDVVAHTVSVMVVQAGGARRILDKDPDRAVEAAVRIEATGRAALAEMRRLLGILGSGDGDASFAPQPTLDDVGALVERANAAGLRATLHVDGERRELPAGAEVAAYRVVQEALTNALKHAGAAQTEVLLRWHADALELVVADRGPAPGRRHGDAADLPSGGHGIVGMRERVKVYGGELTANPRPDGGFVVRARIPVGKGELVAA